MFGLLAGLAKGLAGAKGASSAIGAIGSAAKDFAQNKVESKLRDTPMGRAFGAYESGKKIYEDNFSQKDSSPMQSSMTNQTYQMPEIGSSAAPEQPQYGVMGGSAMKRKFSLMGGS